MQSTGMLGLRGLRGLPAAGFLASDWGLAAPQHTATPAQPSRHAAPRESEQTTTATATLLHIATKLMN